MDDVTADTPGDATAGTSAVDARAAAAALLAAAAEACDRGEFAAAQEAWRAAREADHPRAEAWLHAAAAPDPALTAEARVDLLRAAAERFPASAGVLHDLARAAVRAGDWDTARDAWTKVIVLNPALAWGHVGLAEAERAQGDLTAAEATLRAGIAACPDAPDCPIALARLAEERGDPADALSHWERVCAAWPDRIEGALGSAQAFERLGRHEESRAAYARIAERFPDRLDAVEKLARAAEAARDWPAAETWWRRFVALRPSIWWGHTALATVLQHQGRTDDAGVVLAGAEAALPQEPAILVHQVRLDVARGDHAAAERRCAAMQARFPQDWRGWREAIAVMRTAGRHEEADAFLLEHAPRFPTDIDALHDYGWLAERWKDWAEAEAIWRRVLAREPRAGWAWVGLARTFRSQGRWADARAVLTEAGQVVPNYHGIATEAAALQAASDPAAAPERQAAPEPKAEPVRQEEPATRPPPAAVPQEQPAPRPEMVTPSPGEAAAATPQAADPAPAPTASPKPPAPMRAGKRAGKRRKRGR